MTFGFCTAAFPTPMLMTIFSSRGTAIEIKDASGKSFTPRTESFGAAVATLAAVWDTARGEADGGID